MPFLAEELFQNLVRGVDAAAPEQRAPDAPIRRSTTRVRDPELERLMDLHAAASPAWATPRARAPACARSSRCPRVRVAGGSTFRELPEWASALIQDELNVKRVEYAQELSEAVRQRAEANPKILGPKYGKDYPRIRAALQEGRFDRRRRPRTGRRLGCSSLTK